MSESKLWKIIKPLQNYGHIQRIECSFPVGVPDMIYKINNIAGWCELKYVKEYPKRGATPIRVKHYTKAQKTFLGELTRHKWKTRVMVQVEEDIYLFASPALFAVGQMTRLQMFENCLLVTNESDNKFIEKLARGLVYE